MKYSIERLYVNSSSLVKKQAGTSSLLKWYCKHSQQIPFLEQEYVQGHFSKLSALFIHSILLFAKSYEPLAICYLLFAIKQDVEPYTFSLSSKAEALSLNG